METVSCLARFWTDSYIFIDYVSHDGSIRINSEVYRNILPNNVQINAYKRTGRKVILHQNDDSKHTVITTKDFHRGKKWVSLDRAGRWPDHNTKEHSFLKEETPRKRKELKAAALNVWITSHMKSAKCWWYQWMTGLIRVMIACIMETNIKWYLLQDYVFRLYCSTKNVIWCKKKYALSSLRNLNASIRKYKVNYSINACLLFVFSS